MRTLLRGDPMRTLRRLIPAVLLMALPFAAWASQVAADACCSGCPLCPFGCP